MWTTAASDLRNLLSDNPTDKYAYRKRVFGIINGANKVFKTFEWRRVTNFVSASAPLGVYVNHAAVTASADSTEMGEFTVTTAPVDGDLLQATYYYQWFIDAEIVTFLTNACQWLGYGSDYVNIGDGLRPAATHFAAQEAYQKLALRWAQRESEVYMLEDAPREGDSKAAIESYLNLAKFMREKSVELRDNFYTRQGQALAPMSTSLFGRVGSVAPRR